jgi:N-acetylneuraminic acid mutarotase
MNQAFRITAILGALSLVACDESTSPTQPNTGNPAQAPPSLALSSNTWVRRARVRTARIDHVAGVVNNAAGEPVLYIFGGNDPIEEFPVETIEGYNYVTNRWTLKRPTIRASEMNGAGVIGGKVYLGGGFVNTGDGFAALQTMYAYDPATDRLTRKANIPRPSAGGVSGVISGKLYLLIGSGGDFGDRTSRRFYRYNPATNAWSSLPSCPHVHIDGAGAVSKGKFYVAGGFNGTRVTATLDVYDPVTNSWSTRASLPVSRANAAGAAILGKFYVMGGGDAARTVYAFDPLTNTWKSRASLLTGRHSLAAAPLVTPAGNSKILAVGGFKFADSTSASANELYTP